MKVDKEFVLREIAGDYIIIPTGKTVLEFNGLITVNEVGVSLWNMLQNETTLEELVQGILDEYDVEEEVAREDIQEFLDTLVSGGILAKDIQNADEESI
ncbi:MAG: PqqD family protein [Eubacteriales bacterium]|nr:PqqD family protein [Eubacteriales bacterium]